MQQLLRFPIDNAWLSGLVWVVLTIIALYVARRPAHILIRTFGQGCARGLRRANRTLVRSRERLARGYRRRLTTWLREHTELQTLRQLHRLEDSINRDLSGIPHLHRSLRERLQRLDEDYRRTVESPPAPPEWLRAVESVATLERPDDPSVVRVLEDMHTTLERACHNTLQSYRLASHRRHRVLRRMVPLWRRMYRTLDDIQCGVGRVESRTATLGRQIQQFQMFAERHRDHARRAAGLVFTRWCGALAMLVIIALAAVTLHSLIARPLAEASASLGEGPHGSPFNLWLSASLIGLLAINGLVITEATGITRLITGLSSARFAPRVILGSIAGALLALLATTSAALAWTRGYLLGADEATRALFSAAGGGFPDPAFNWIPAIAESVLALGLALSVALTAIPFESVLRLGALAATVACAAILRLGAAVCSGLAALTQTLTRVLLAAYDVLIFVPLFIERTLRHRRVRPPATLSPIHMKDAS